MDPIFEWKRPAQRGLPPRAAVTAVKACLVGILGLPILAPLLLSLTERLGPAGERLRMVGAPATVLVWLLCVGAALDLVHRFPPVGHPR